MACQDCPFHMARLAVFGTPPAVSKNPQATSRSPAPGLKVVRQVMNALVNPPLIPVPTEDQVPVAGSQRPRYWLAVDPPADVNEPPTKIFWPEPSFQPFKAAA